MNPSSSIPFRLTRAALVVGGLFGVQFAAQTASPLVPASDPLGTGSTSVKPNVMFILDDSGSMDRDSMPDYLDDTNNSTANTTAACYDHGDSTDGSGVNTIDGPTRACIYTDPPFMSSDLNTIYYNPELRYRPGITIGGGSEMTIQNSTNTSGYTQVLTDAYIGGGSTVDLTTEYQDRVWCLATSDLDDGPNCFKNSAYAYPSSNFSRGNTTGGSVKYVYGAPYYYRIKTAQYCDTDARTSCRSGSAVNPATDLFQAPEFCTDLELTTCAAGSGVTSSHVFSGTRWCSDAGTLLNCQRKKIGTFKYPKHLGTTTTGTVVARQSTGILTAATPSTSASTILDVLIAGVSIVSPTTGVSPTAISVPASQSAAQVAALIAGRFQSNSYTMVYTPGDSFITFQAPITGTPTPTQGAYANGRAITISSSQFGSTASRGKITVNTTNTTGSNIGSVKVNGVQLLTCAPVTTMKFSPGGSSLRTAEWRAGGGLNLSGSASQIVGDTDSVSTNWRNAVRDALKTAIDACRTMTAPAGSGGLTGTAATVAYTTSTSGLSSNELYLVAATSLGSTPNGYTVVTGSNATAMAITNCNMGTSSCAGGTSGVGAFTSHVTGSSPGFSGGRDQFTGVVRIGQGSFVRTDIVPGNDSYPKTNARADCAGATCTYDEEMTNFSNWYAYHRTRLQMAKTAAGRAFNDIDNSYRVGFITICPLFSGDVGSGTGEACSQSTSSVATGKSIDTTGRYLRIADFASGQKTSWYTLLYGIETIGSTPLREALARVGLIYAGKVGTAAQTAGLTKGLTNVLDDPVTSECQPNFAILSTDGYWNGGPGRQLDGTTAIGNQDNANSGYSKRTDGVYEGTTAAADTLADVALYYYKTDLRTSMSDSVPITNKDSNNQQHMVTFTLGLGLDGELTYRSDYETATSGDFYDIKQGTKDWPAPSSGQPSTLDDLWHAAVAGRGVFFSAKDPETLALSLTETLNQLQARVGAGAAAATSNLQPVAGDNFAFTAQYQTNDWIGDLKARTIDLGTGTVSSITLWAAAALLDGTDHVDRRIYTFDSGDTAGVGANRLKHFCMAADVSASWCDDGAGLTVTEANYFDSSLFALDQENLWTSMNMATSSQMVNYLRGDAAYVNTGITPRTSTDLFRRRTSILGDIVNAQPAYVQKSPFSYADTGFTGFKACTTGTGTGCPIAQFPDSSKERLGTVYAAANDGMLHAFETDVNDNPYYQTAGIATAVTADDAFSCNPLTCNVNNGKERWAYIPGILLPELYQLAGEPYNHRYYTDGTPQVGDICLSLPCAGQDDWRTILVSGFNSGGKGYYALDVTNPAAPKAMWEFTHTPGNCVEVTNPGSGARNGDKGVPTGGPFYGDCYLGLSFGNPVITKRKRDGKWVVIVSSGYNNTTPTGTVGSVNASTLQGQGFLYILDAATGEILNRLSTGNGTAASPSGLSRINAWATSASTDNTALAIYGGDLDGFLWRFDVDYGDVSIVTAPSNANYHSVTPVARAKDASTTVSFQPITSKPELGEYATKRIIMFGTGKFLETGDKNPPYKSQTLYAVRDEPSTVTNASYPATCDAMVVCNVRDTSKMKVRVLSGTGNTRTISAGTAPSWSTDDGWLIDLPEAGERVNVDPQLQLGTLVVATNVPSTGSCTAGGFSFINFLDYATGSYIPGASGNAASQKIGSSLTVGLNVVMLPGGKVVTIATTADNQQLTQDTPIPPGSFTGRRVSWRELIRDQ